VGAPGLASVHSLTSLVGTTALGSSSGTTGADGSETSSVASTTVSSADVGLREALREARAAVRASDHETVSKSAGRAAQAASFSDVLRCSKMQKTSSTVH
jgi:hypothetical protein